ncbi:MAG TPA: hypothetical protein V6C81_04045 [Planktothrix sp.]
MDAEKRTCILNIGNLKFNLTFEPGSGFVDGSNGNLLLEAKPIH